jgi:elongation factor 3
MSAATGNKQSIKILDELLQKLTIAKDESEVSAASHSLASFINGAIEEQE